MHSLHQLLLASASYLSLFSCHRSNLTMMMLFLLVFLLFLIFLFLFVRLFLVFLLRFLLLVFLFLLLTVGIRTIRRRARHGFFSNYTCCKCACRFALLILLYEDIKVDKTWYRPAKRLIIEAVQLAMSSCPIAAPCSGYVWLSSYQWVHYTLAMSGLSDRELALAIISWEFNCGDCGGTISEESLGNGHIQKYTKITKQKLRIWTVHIKIDKLCQPSKVAGADIDTVWKTVASSTVLKSCLMRKSPAWKYYHIAYKILTV